MPHIEESEGGQAQPLPEDVPFGEFPGLSAAAGLERERDLWEEAARELSQ